MKILYHGREETKVEVGTIPFSGVFEYMGEIYMRINDPSNKDKRTTYAVKISNGEMFWLEIDELITELSGELSVERVLRESKEVTN